MRRSKLLALLVFSVSICAAARVAAHPSVSVVIAPDGSVYYSDLQQVWRIAPTGEKRVVVPNVHTHELAVDRSGAIYGEDSKWLGGDRYRHRIWKRSADGRMTDVIPWSDGFSPAYGFTRDGTGAMYWITCTLTQACTIGKGHGIGQPTTVVSRGPFRTRINWIVASPAGEVFVIDGPDLRKVNRQGRIETVARLSKRVDGRHQLMGLSRDRAGNLYVAAHADRKVFRVSPAGRVQLVAQSSAPWAPTGVAVSPAGDFWILEWSGTATRVRRVSARGVTTIY